MMKSQGEWAILGVFFSLTVHCTLKLGTHIKTTEPIEMPFAMMTRVDRKYHVIYGGLDAPWERGNYWGKRSGPL